MVRGVIAASTCSGIHSERNRIDINEYRCRTRVADSRNRRDKGIRHRDDLIAGPNVRREQREVQRARARVDADTNPGAREFRKLFLEFHDLAPERELAGIEHPLDGGIHLVLDAGVLSLKVNKWNHNFFL